MFINIESFRGASTQLMAIKMWPIWCAFGLMLVAAISYALTTRVPNTLTLSATVLGWLVALAISFSRSPVSNGGGIDASLSAALLGFFLLVPFFAISYLAHLGAGCVKMQAAFGAWIGCAVPLHQAMVLTLAGTIAGIILTAIHVGFQFGFSRLRKRSMTGVRASSEVMPAQITLSIGSILGVIAAAWLGLT